MSHLNDLASEFRILVLLRRAAYDRGDHQVAEDLRNKVLSLSDEIIAEIDALQGASLETSQEASA